MAMLNNQRVNPIKTYDISIFLCEPQPLLRRKFTAQGAKTFMASERMGWSFGLSILYYIYIIYNHWNAQRHSRTYMYTYHTYKVLITAVYIYIYIIYTHYIYYIMTIVSIFKWFDIIERSSVEQAEWIFFDCKKTAESRQKRHRCSVHKALI